jgi:hypothetical protein
MELPFSVEFIEVPWNDSKVLFRIHVDSTPGTVSVVYNPNKTTMMSFLSDFDEMRRIYAKQGKAWFSKKPHSPPAGAVRRQKHEFLAEGWFLFILPSEFDSGVKLSPGDIRSMTVAVQKTTTVKEYLDTVQNPGLWLAPFTQNIDAKPAVVFAGMTSVY